MRQSGLKSAAIIQTVLFCMILLIQQAEPRHLSKRAAASSILEGDLQHLDLPNDENLSDLLNMLVSEASLLNREFDELNRSIVRRRELRSSAERERRDGKQLQQLLETWAPLGLTYGSKRQVQQPLYKGRWSHFMV